MTLNEGIESDLTGGVPRGPGGGCLLVLAWYPGVTFKSRPRLIVANVVDEALEAVEGSALFGRGPERSGGGGEGGRGGGEGDRGGREGGKGRGGCRGDKAGTSEVALEGMWVEWVGGWGEAACEGGLAAPPPVAEKAGYAPRVEKEGTVLGGATIHLEGG